MPAVHPPPFSAACGSSGRLLAGLLLAALLPARGQEAAGPVVSLPPLLVETKGGPQWRYGEAPGLRVLSCCDDDTSRDFAERNFRQQEMLDELVAADLQMSSSAPVVMILYDQRYRAALASEVVDEMNRMAPHSDPSATGVSGVGLVPHLRLSDPDSTEIYLLLEDKAPDLSTKGRRLETGGGYETLEFSADYVAMLLDGRTPQLPPWFRAGLLRLYQDVRFDGSRIEIEPFEWLPPADGDFLANTLAFGSELLPPAEIFSPSVLPDGSDPLPVRARAWAAESALFIRWALEGRGHPRREALWRFVRQASAAPATEAMFRQCFGLGYAELAEQLARYLPDARRELSWEAPPAPKRPWLGFHDATPAQVREIKGDWGRRVLDVIGREHPQLLAGYVARARQTLLDAYAQGDRSAELLASLGQLYFQTGDRFQARAYLESAVQAGVARPMPYVELAQLRLINALGPSRSRLGRAELGATLAPLTAARGLQPALLPGYLLLAAAWQHSAARPTASDLAALNDGARLFHRNRQLVLAAAELDLEAGDPSEARGIVALALGSAPDAPSRQALLAFQAGRLAKTGR
ncbi:MAG TPA: hypothetical protein VHC86_13885 [Opitutaceae bacterium]|nr:hypothetical protein [Opitutaceae bacterium]